MKREHVKRRAISRVGAIVVTTTVVVGALASVVLQQDPAAADDCIAVPMAVQLNQFPLMPELAKRFNGSGDANVDGRCIQVSVSPKSSGAAATLLEQGWPDTAENGPRPVVWSPAATAWADVLNQRLADSGKPAMAPGGAPIMVSPLVIAMPQPMAEALGWPNSPIGYRDILQLATDPAGWGSRGQDYGAFRLGKTNPNFSTSGLSSLVAQYYAFVGKQRDLTNEDIDNPTVDQDARAVESSVVHYGDTTLTFLNHLYEADQRGAPFSYASAVAVEEQSVVNYNNGNPDGKLDPGEEPTPPRVKLVAIYPSEGTLFSDNPYIVLDAKWVSAEQKRAAKVFGDFVQRPVNQRKVLKFGFRPGNDAVALGAPIDVKHGLDPLQPQTAQLELPASDVLANLIDHWNDIRKGARVLMVVDVSGSMGDRAESSKRVTKLDLAKRAAAGSLDAFRDDDQVGMWAFSTDIGTAEHPEYEELAGIAPIGPARDVLKSQIQGLGPEAQTPLYDVTQDAYESLDRSYDPSLINTVVLLSDGKDQGSHRTWQQVRESLRGKGEAINGPAVRIFTVAYGEDADVNAMQQIAKATNGAYYDATDPSTIVDVLNAVTSNF